MRYYIVLAYVYGLVRATHQEARSAKVDLSSNGVDTLRLPIVRRQNNFNPPSQTYTLFRRGDRSPGNRGQTSPTRSGSPNARSKVTAKGPADMYIQDSRGRRQEQVSRGGGSGTMRSVAHSDTAAWGKSVGGEQSRQPRAQQITATAKGRAVYGEVKPSPGGTGNIKVYGDHGRGNADVYHIPGDGSSGHVYSSDSEGVLIKATTNHGGQAVAVSTSDQHKDPKVPDYVK